MLNKIWGSFFFVAFLVAMGRWLLQGEYEVWAAMVSATFDMAKTAFEIALGLTGVMCLWLGIMKLGEKGGAVDLLAQAFGPLLRRLFPDIPDGHPAIGSIVMNMAANMLGLDNAATPLGLKAMSELQELNPDKDTATNDQILFLVINTSAVTLIPMTIFTYRAQLGAADPTDVFIPLIIATYCSTLVGLVVTATVQRLRLLDPVVLAYLGAMTAGCRLVGLLLFAASPARSMERQSSLLSNFTIFAVIIAFLVLAARRRVPLYETFVEGAKDGFEVAVGIIPYLVAMLVAIGVFRASGALDLLLDGVRWGVDGMGIDTRWVDGLPTALMRPLSGSGARGMMLETMKTHGPRLVRRPAGERDPGQHRDDLLRPGGLLRVGRHSQHPPRRRLRPGRRPGRRHRCDPRHLLLLRLKPSARRMAWGLRRPGVPSGRSLRAWGLRQPTGSPADLWGSVGVHCLIASVPQGPAGARGSAWGPPGGSCSGREDSPLGAPTSDPSTTSRCPSDHPAGPPALLRAIGREGLARIIHEC